MHIMLSISAGIGQIPWLCIQDCSCNSSPDNIEGAAYAACKKKAMDIQSEY